VDRPSIGVVRFAANPPVLAQTRSVSQSDDGGDAARTPKPSIAWSDAQNIGDHDDEQQLLRRSSKDLFVLENELRESLNGEEVLHRPPRLSEVRLTQGTHPPGTTGATVDLSPRSRSLASAYSSGRQSDGRQSPSGSVLGLSGSRSSALFEGHRGRHSRGRGRLSLWGEMNPEEIEKELEEAAKKMITSRIAVFLENGRVASASITITAFYAVFACITFFFNPEIDDGQMMDIDGPTWVAFVDLILLTLFLVEIALFSTAYGSSFIFDPWNILDFFVVVISLIFSIGTLSFGADKLPKSIAPARSMLRMLRIVVLFRRLSERSAAIIVTFKRGGDQQAATAAELLLEVLNSLSTNQRLPRTLRREIGEAMKDIRSGGMFEVNANTDLDGHENEWIHQGMNQNRRRQVNLKVSKDVDGYCLKIESPGPVASKWFSHDAHSGVPRVNSITAERAAQRDFLSGINHWSMDVLALGEAVAHPLPLMFAYLVESNELLDLVSGVQQLENFLIAIESHYHPTNPYHNALHACDVLFSVFWILHSCLGQKVIGADETDCFAMFFAAMVHDLDHPGETNAYQIAVGSPFAILYNDRSVLENHHVALAHHCLEPIETNIFSRLGAAKRAEIRGAVINMVLATDMTKHFIKLGELNGRLSEPGSFPDREKPKDKELMMNMVVHACDMCNPSKETHIAVKWTTLVMTEFFEQGDKEREHGFTCSQFMDRRTTNIGTCQVGFIDFLVLPLYQSMVQVLPGLAEAVENIGTNRKFWRSIVDLCADRIAEDDPVQPADLQTLFENYNGEVTQLP
jgi:hypothetical protein